MWKLSLSLKSINNKAMEYIEVFLVLKDTVYRKEHSFTFSGVFMPCHGVTVPLIDLLNLHPVDCYKQLDVSSHTM